MNRDLRRQRTLSQLCQAGPQAVMLMAGAAAAATSFTWDPSHNTATLSNGNLTSANGSGTMSWGTTSHTSGKWYFEVLLDSVGSTYPGIGIADGYTVSGFNSNAWIVDCPSSNSTYGDGSYKSQGIALANGNIIGIAVDITAGKIWFARNNTYILSGNPSAGTSPTWTSVHTSGVIRPFVRFNSGQVTIQSILTYVAPTGFSPW